MAARDDVFEAIAHPVRRTILDRLVKGERNAGELAKMFDISFAAVSQNLRQLRESGLVSVRRIGRERRYRLNPKRLRRVHAWLRKYESGWRRTLRSLKTYVEGRS